MNANPFHNTKATYYEDLEIVKFWVPPAKKNDSFAKIMMPDMSMPVRILGGKGSGKTHILRFYSFNAQKLRAKDNGVSILEEIMKNKYIGVYTVASGLQVNRFSGRGIDDEKWTNIFYYYINLELLERILKKVLIVLNDVSFNYEGDLEDLKSLFFNADQINDATFLSDIYDLVKKERVSIDQMVARLSLPGNKCELNIDPIFSIEDNFFSIVKEIFINISELKNVRVLYIIDEFENYSEEQQKFFNTLIRQSKFPKIIGFRIAGRLYAVKTRYTLDDKEILQEDAEIKTIYLEDKIGKDFKDFSKELYLSRIKNNLSIDTNKIDFNKTFQTSKECEDKELADIARKHQGKSKQYFINLEKSLKYYFKGLSEKKIELIIQNLKYNDNWFLEKINIWLLFQSWKGNLLEVSQRIKESCLVYVTTGTGDHKKTIEKYGSDMKYQLFKTYGRSLSYSGYDNILQMSNRNPRIFLSILNNIFIECSGSRIDMLSENTVTCRIQDMALLESSKWFWNNFVEDMQDSRIEWAIVNLCEFFRKVRRSDKPVEKDLIMFTYFPHSVEQEVNNLITLAVNHSLLIEQKVRDEKNSGKLTRKLRIHPMLAPKWELSISGGGDTKFSSEEITALFYNKKEWDILSDKKITKWNIPFSVKAKVEEEIETKDTLFEDYYADR